MKNANKQKKSKSSIGKKRVRDGIILWLAGGKKWKTKKSIRTALNKFKPKEVTCIVMGISSGVEQMAYSIARDMGFDVVRVSPNFISWDSNAIYLRNDWISRFFKPDFLLAFHQDIDNSKDTAQCIRLAKKRDIEFRLVKK